MSRDCPVVPARMALAELVREHILRTGQRCFIVVDGSRLEGLVTLHQIKAVPQERWAQVSVGEAMTPVSQSQVLIVIALALVGTGYTMFNVPYMAMPSEIADDYHERTRMMSWRVGLIGVGTLVGASAQKVAELLGELLPGDEARVDLRRVVAGSARRDLERRAQAGLDTGTLPGLQGAGATYLMRDRWAIGVPASG